MEESESLDSEMTGLQEFQDEALSQDDEDEVEELQNRYFFSLIYLLTNFINRSFCFCVERFLLSLQMKHQCFQFVTHY